MSQPIWGRIYTETLPSGTKVRAKRVSNIQLLWAGAFPAELTGLVWKMANQEVDVKRLVETPAELQKMVGIIEQVVPHVLVSPKVGDKTELKIDESGVAEGIVLLADIPDLDKTWLLLFGQGLIRSEDEREADKLVKPGAGAKTGPDSFRDGSVRSDAGPAGAEVQPAAVGDRGDSPGESTGA